MKTTWEYRRESMNYASDDTEILNGLGADGWEVCGYHFQGQNRTFILKRQIS